MIDFDIDFIPPLSTVAHDFWALADELEIRNFREPLQRAIDQVIAPAFTRNFSAEGRPAWTPLADLTVERRSKEGSGTTILDRTGKLKRVAGDDSIWNIDESSGEAYIDNLGGAEDYGLIQHFGGQSGVNHATTIPARPWATITAAEQDQIAEVFGVWLDERIVVYLGLDS